MSFSIYFSAFHDGGSFEFDRSVVENVFAKNIVLRDGRRMHLEYDDGSWSDMYMEKERIVHGFSVNHPSVNRAFWEAILYLLQRLPAALYWDGKGCVVANPAVSTQLPSEMVKALGEPIVVTRIEQIREAMKLV